MAFFYLSFLHDGNRIVNKVEKNFCHKIVIAKFILSNRTAENDVAQNLNE